MSEIPHHAEPARPAAPEESDPAPITSLKGYWAVVLPLIGLGAQFLIGLAVGLVGAAGGAAQSGSPLMILIAIAGLAALAYFLIVHILLSSRGWRWRDLGFREGADVPVFVAIGIGLVTAALARLFELSLRPPGTSVFGDMAGAELAGALIVIGILVPIAEEAMFRGIVYPVLRARIGGTAGAVLVSALIFGAFHLYPLQILVGFVLGLPLAWLRQWSGALVAPIALHMTHNLGVVLLAALRVV
jgi:membrane protease YdiL (CAAX protease family)